MQEKKSMPDPSSTQSFITAFLASARGRLITALTIIVLLLGIATEVISLVTGYYNMTKVRAEAETAGAQAQASAGINPAAVPSPGHKSGHGRYNAITITSLDDCNNDPALNTNDPEWNELNQARCGIGARLARARAGGSSTFSYQYTPED
jgi:hypothetical protein